ncbi:hypothetical protein GRS80_10110 [Natrialba sp. INN-245]|nr:hypothetical protein [Natrialba sp. INN-245]
MAGSVWDDESWNSRQFNVENCSPTVAVIKTVSQATGKCPTDLPPLADYTEPEALDQLLGATEAVTVQFEYDGIDVLIVGSGVSITV